nr:MAG TPA: hypothetical protein [Caudoviricetes sp.]
MIHEYYNRYSVKGIGGIMEYKVINEELNIKACRIGDLTMQQVQSFLKLWNDGSSISTLTAFIDEEDKALVLNKDNKNYNLYLTMREKYLSTTDEKRTDFREKSKDNPHYETVCLLDKLIELRRVGEVMKMLGSQKEKYVDYPKHVFDGIIKNYDFSDERFHMWKAYTYGIIQGKRAERARRKAGAVNEAN